MKIESKGYEGRINPNVVTVVVAALLVSALVGGTLYFNSPQARADNLIASAGQSIDEADYDSAVSDLKGAFALDPENEEANKIINSYLTLILDKADDTENPEKKKWIAAFVSEFETDIPVFRDTLNRADEITEEAQRKIDSTPYVEKADALFDKGEYNAAAKEYETAIEKGAKQADLQPRYDRNCVYLKLREMAAMPDRTGIIDYMNSVSFDCIREQLKETRLIDISDERYLAISKRNDDYLITYGSFDNKKDGCAVGMMSCTDKNALYEGEWSKGAPNGYGRMYIWDKDKDIGDSYCVSGTLEKGYFKGDVTYEDKDIPGTVIPPIEKEAVPEDEQLPEDEKEIYSAGVPTFADDANTRDLLLEAKTIRAEQADEAEANKKKKKGKKQEKEEEEVPEERDYPGIDYFDATLWPMENVPFEFDGSDLKAGVLAAGSPARIVAERSDSFYVRVGDKKGFVDKKLCLINLPDVMPKEMQYDITNSHCCIYKIDGKRIRNVTGTTFYLNADRGNGVYLVPLLYPEVHKLYKAEEEILKQGRTLKIYDTYQPAYVTKTVYEETSSYVKEKEDLNTFITSEGNKLRDFVPEKDSDHNFGTALDLTLSDLSTGEEIKMQTPVHELGPDSLAAKNTSDAGKLKELMEEQGFTASENLWWHFDMPDQHNKSGSFQVIPYSESHAW